MKRPWPTREIQEIADVIGGSTPSTKDPTNFDGNVPWLTPKDLSESHDRVVFRGKRNLSDAGLASCSARLLPAGSVLLSTRAPIGYVAIAGDKISTNQGFRSLILKDDVLPSYIYYWLKQNTIELEKYSSGSTFKELSGSALRKIRVPIPPLSEQCRISEILGTLDDKIELNRRINETLEATALAIFKDWFVDFGPTRAKVEGNAPYLAPEVWNLFPNSIDAEDKPMGWQIATVGDCFHVTMGQSPPGSTYNGNGIGLPFFQGRTDFGFRYPENRKFCTAPKRIAEVGDTLVSVRAPVGDINMAYERCCAGRGIAALRHKSKSRSFTYYSARSIEQQLKEYEHTGTVFGAINRAQFTSLDVVEPSPAMVAIFERQIYPLDERIRKNVSESRTLTQTRDMLLSKLISGEIRIDEAEKVAEVVA